jgi:hypothetical protein
LSAGALNYPGHELQAPQIFNGNRLDVLNGPDDRYLENFMHLPSTSQKVLEESIELSTSSYQPWFLTAAPSWTRLILLEPFNRTVVPVLIFGVPAPRDYTFL